MSKDEKRTQRGPGGFEDKIDAAMADLEVDLDDEFHGQIFLMKRIRSHLRMGISIPGMTQMRPMIRRTPAEEDYEEEYPEEEEYDSEYSDEFEEESEADDDEEESEEFDEEDDSYDDESDVPQERELQVEKFSTRSGRKRSRREKKESTSEMQSARPHLVPLDPPRLPMFLFLKKSWTRKSFPSRKRSIKA